MISNFVPTSLTSRWPLHSRGLNESEKQRRRKPCTSQIMKWSSWEYIMRIKTSPFWGPRNDWPNVVELEESKNWRQLGNNHSAVVHSIDSIVGKCTMYLWNINHKIWIISTFLNSSSSYLWNRSLLQQTVLIIANIAPFFSIDIQALHAVRDGWQYQNIWIFRKVSGGEGQSKFIMQILDLNTSL